MPHAKQAAQHRAAAIGHLEVAAEHHRQSVTFQKNGDHERALRHAAFAHTHAKRAVEHHGKAAKVLFDYRA